MRVATRPLINEELNDKSDHAHPLFYFYSTYMYKTTTGLLRSKIL